LCINPTVIQYTEETQLDAEGCLSFPSINILVQRPRDVLVEYYNEDLEKVRTVASDYSARLYLHELDHLNGITFKDRVSKLKWNLAEKKAKKLVRR
jgi:peptide deformylase